MASFAPRQRRMLQKVDKELLRVGADKLSNQEEASITLLAFHGANSSTTVQLGAVLVAAVSVGVTTMFSTGAILENQVLNSSAIED